MLQNTVSVATYGQRQGMLHALQLRKTLKLVGKLKGNLPLGPCMGGREDKQNSS